MQARHLTLPCGQATLYQVRSPGATHLGAASTLDCSCQGLTPPFTEKMAEED